MGEIGQRHVPAAFCPRGKDPQYPLDRRLGGPQSRSGHRGSRKNHLPLPGIEHRSSGRWSQTLYRLSYPFYGKLQIGVSRSGKGFRSRCNDRHERRRMAQRGRKNCICFTLEVTECFPAWLLRRSPSVFNPFKSRGCYMYHLLYQSHAVFCIGSFRVMLGVNRD
jgi:hypothetical protein